MKYNGIELNEITEPQIFDTPKKMLVWNNVMQEPTTGDVVAIVRRNDGICAMCFDGECYPYCAEFGRLTNREFSRWLAKGYGECRSSSGCADTAWIYDTELDDKPVVEWTKARKWDDSEWHEPTVEYCKELKPE